MKSLTTGTIHFKHFYVFVLLLLVGHISDVRRMSFELPRVCAALCRHAFFPNQILKELLMAEARLQKKRESLGNPDKYFGINALEWTISLIGEKDPIHPYFRDLITVAEREGNESKDHPNTLLALLSVPDIAVGFTSLQQGEMTEAKSHYFRFGKLILEALQDRGYTQPGDTDNFKQVMKWIYRSSMRSFEAARDQVILCSHISTTCKGKITSDRVALAGKNWKQGRQLVLQRKRRGETEPYILIPGSLYVPQLILYARAALAAEILSG